MRKEGGKGNERRERERKMREERERKMREEKRGEDERRGRKGR